MRISRPILASRLAIFSELCFTRETVADFQPHRVFFTVGSSAVRKRDDISRVGTRLVATDFGAGPDGTICSSAPLAPGRLTLRIKGFKHSGVTVSNIRLPRLQWLV